MTTATTMPMITTISAKDSRRFTGSRRSSDRRTKIRRGAGCTDSHGLAQGFAPIPLCLPPPERCVWLTLQCVSYHHDAPASGVTTRSAGLARLEHGENEVEDEADHPRFSRPKPPLWASWLGRVKER